MSGVVFQQDVYLSDQGGFASVVNTLSVLFGKSRFSEADQAAEPTKPLTRLVKDVLRVGKWKVGRDAHGKPQLADFSASVLKTIVEQFRAAKARGVTFNLCNTHGDRQTREVHPEDLIAPIDELAFDGTTLWASFYVTPEQAVYLSNPARKVSAGLRENWQDGYGNEYPLQLVHVAVCDQPAVAGQGEFIALANTQEVSAMDFQALVAAINALLTRFGMGSLPSEVDETNIVVALKALAGGDSEDESQEGATPMTTTADMSLSAKREADELKSLLEVIRQLQDGQAALSNELANMRAASAQAAYVGKLDRLASNGDITADVVTKFTATGAKLGWDLSLLDGLEGLKLAPRGSVAKKLATGKAPDVEGVTEDLSQEDIASTAKSLAALANSV